MSFEITIDRWREAQAEERKHHQEVFEKAAAHYEESYRHYFEFTGIDRNLKGKSIVEIGPAKVAGLYFCNNYAPSFVIEPTIYEDALPFYDKKISFIHEPAEICDFPKVDEAWLFNVLEHTINPIKIIELCKTNCKVVRFFEPDGCGGKDLAHPHCITSSFLKDHFGEENVKIYKGGTVDKNFHGANCAYGVWRAAK